VPPGIPQDARGHEAQVDPGGLGGGRDPGRPGDPRGRVGRPVPEGPRHPGAPERRSGKAPYALLLPSWLTLGLFFAVPLAIMTVVSGGERARYGGLAPIGDLGAYLRSGRFAANYVHSFTGVYLEIGWRSLWMAAAATAACLAISFPVAYHIALRAPRRARNLLLGLVVVPFWTSFLIRTYAWMFLLRNEGLINQALAGLGLVTHPLQLLYTQLAVGVGLVYGELPFMILPLYAALEKIDRSLLEAAADLGAGRLAVLRRVTVPLAAPGIAAGILLVFIPSLGQFIVSDLLGGARSMLLGNLVQNQFAVARNQPFGAALAVELMTAVLLLLFVYNLFSRRRGGEELLP
jgi:spermidine/putrescine transport system permease protein